MHEVGPLGTAQGGGNGYGGTGLFQGCEFTDEGLLYGFDPIASLRMEIELPDGCRLIVGNDVDTAVLGRVIRALLHR